MTQELINSNELKDLLQQFVDNLIIIDSARDRNNEIMKEVKALGVNTTLARKAAKILREENKNQIDEAHHELMELVNICE